MSGIAIHLMHNSDHDYTYCASAEHRSESLVYFVVLAEERTLSRAARRLFLSQPSMTRALQKLREAFDDALLVRNPSGYVLTPKGENLLQEVVQFLPRLDRLLSGREFDPAQESAHFRIAATDNATQLYGPRRTDIRIKQLLPCFTVSRP
jgi:DNA-binding transcriptional LysR family regulator